MLREARKVARLTSEEEILLFRRLIDLLRYRLGEPTKAAPELARLAELHPETEAGKWAREELTALKEEMLDQASS